MPSGDPDFHIKELPTLERFFARIGPTIIQFTKRHRLEIQRYYHQLPSWQLCFAHPHGGAAYVEIRRVDDDTIRIYLSWWIDDYDKARRSSRHTKRDPFPVEGTDIEEALRDAFHEVLSWQVGSWSSVHSGYEHVWHTMSKCEFERMSDIYPTPTL